LTPHGKSTAPLPETQRRTRTGVRSASEEETKLREETVRADLGQKEAELERSSKERMEHMEGEKPK